MLKKKKIILDVNHPSDVHFIKNLYFELIKLNHKVLVTASQKPLTYELLEELKIPHIKLGTYGVTNVSKGINLIWLNLKMLIICLKFRPDAMLGLISFRVAHIGWLLNIASFVFDDTDHATEQLALLKPFAHRLYTPINFKGDLGKNHRRYHGYHELAYLHPNYFNPNKGILNLLGVKEGEIYTIVRFVAWNATHDKGMIKGFTKENKIKLVNEFSKFGKVFITSEMALPTELKDYAIQIPFTKIHDAIYYSAMVFGESSTMSSEAAVLGVPSIFVFDGYLCYSDEQEKKYQLVHNFTLLDQKKAIQQGIDILKNTKMNKLFYEQQRQKLLNDKIDVTAFQFELICSSVKH